MDRHAASLEDLLVHAFDCLGGFVDGAEFDVAETDGPQLALKGKSFDLVFLPLAQTAIISDQLGPHYIAKPLHLVLQVPLCNIEKEIANIDRLFWLRRLSVRGSSITTAAISRVGRGICSSAEGLGDRFCGLRCGGCCGLGSR